MLELKTSGRKRYMKRCFLWMFLWPVIGNNIESYYPQQDHLINIINSNIEPMSIKNNISIYSGSVFANTYLFTPVFMCKFSNTSNTKLESVENIEAFLITFKPKENNDISAFTKNKIIAENKIINKVSCILRIREEKPNKETIAKSILLVSNGHDMLKIEADTYMEKTNKKKKLLSHENVLYRINDTKLILKRDIEYVLHSLKKYRVGMKIKGVDLNHLQETGIEVFRDVITNIRCYMIHYYKSHEYGDCGKKKDFDEREYIVFIIGVDDFDKIIYLYLMNNCCEETNV